MWLLTKTAWRNLFRQRRRTFITASAMAISLAMAIPTYGLIQGVRAEFVKGITGLELGHVQLHDPAYPRGQALQSTLRRPRKLLEEIRTTPGVVAAAARARGFALLSHDVKLPLTLVPLAPDHVARRPVEIRFGRTMNPRAPWRADTSLDCEAVISHAASRRHGVVVGNVLAPTAARPGGACERIRIVGLTKAPLAPGDSARLPVGLAAADVIRAFGSRRSTEAISRDAAPIAIVGVEPDQERRVTFMADKVVQGRYLVARAAREMLVGYRLAKIMRLAVGTKVFVQAATLDSSSGTNADTFRVVGIYRTGVDSADRTRVFVHLRDAQRLMSLEGRVHEIALVGRDPERLGSMVKEIKRRVARLRLRIVTRSTGTLAGSRPLKAPVAIRDPEARETDLMIPHDLRPRFDDLPGLEAVAQRVYGRTEVTVPRVLEARVALRGRDPNVLQGLSDEQWQALRRGAPQRGKCAVVVAKPLATRWKLRVGQALIPKDAATGNDADCAQLVVAAIVAQAAPAELARRKQPQAAILSLSDLGPEAASEAGIPLGAVSLLLPSAAASLRFVGVEAAWEARLSGLPTHVARGTYLPRGATEGAWPVLLPEATARRLGVDVGGLVLIRTRDADRRRGWRAARVKGVLQRWRADLPELVLPVFSAQQVDAPRLNARAHEMLLIPKRGTTPESLARAADARLVPLVRTWEEIRPLMKDMAAMQNTFMGIMLFIILTIAGMTVMNTMLMAVFERIREFGVLKSIGMRPVQVFGLIVIETLLLAVLAAGLGGAVGIGLERYLVVHGLDMSSVTGGMTVQGTFINPVWKAVFTVQGVLIPMLMVSMVCLAVSFYPALRAGRLKPVEAMRHHR